MRACQALVRASFRSSWRRLFLESPHLRYEGLYVSRNTYVRQGVAEWRRERTVHLVTYFRYWRFFPDGTLLYRTSPLTIAKVAKSMARNPSTAGGSKAQLKHEQHVHSGRYVVKVRHARQGAGGGGALRCNCTACRAHHAPPHPRVAAVAPHLPARVARCSW